MNKQKRIIIACLAGLVSTTFSSCIKEDPNPAVGTPGDQITIYSLRQVNSGNEVTLDAKNLGGASKIQGVVISDKDGKNVDANTFIIQQGITSSNAFTDIVRGLVVKMNSAPAYSVGDSVEINITGAKLGRANGNLTLSGIAGDKVTVLATGRTPVSRAITRGMLQAEMDQYESTLVSLNADVVNYTAGGTLKGLIELNDNTGSAVYSHTLSDAAAAAVTLPRDAQFTGIAGFLTESGNSPEGARKVIMPRNAADIQFSSGVLYAGFPESFESPDASVKSSYNIGTNIIQLGTGDWYLFQAILGNTPGSDRYNVPGKQGVRMQQNLTSAAYLQMNSDVPEGASKVSVFYGRYGTDARSTFRLEASTNGGTTWTAVGSTVNVPADKLKRQAVWTVNYTGPVRFRLAKGTGTSNNGRANFDDFAIYKN